MSNIDKIKEGGEFIYNSPELMDAKARCREILSQLNDVSETDASKKAAIAARLFGACGDGLVMKPPFFCDYGFNIYIGNNVLINFSCVFLDAAPIYIGDNTLIGPNTGIYCINHDLDPERRKAGFATGGKVIIGKNVWMAEAARFCRASPSEIMRSSGRDLSWSMTYRQTAWPPAIPRGSSDKFQDDVKTPRV